MLLCRDGCLAQGTSPRLTKTRNALGIVAEFTSDLLPTPPYSKQGSDNIPALYIRMPSWITLYSFRFFCRLVTSCLTVPNSRASHGNSTVSDTQAAAK